MEETKPNTGILAIVLVASLFAGWQTLLIVAILLLIFGKIDENTKKIMITVITFLAGVALFNLFWDLIGSGVNLGVNTITDLIGVLNSYLDNPIEILKLQRYLLTPITEIVGIVDRFVEYAILFMKFAFIIAILTNKKMSDNFIFKKINTYVDKFVNYVNSFANNFVNNTQYQQPVNNTNAQVNTNVNYTQPINNQNNFNNQTPPNNGF